MFNNNNNSILPIVLQSYIQHNYTTSHHIRSTTTFISTVSNSITMLNNTHYNNTYIVHPHIVEVYLNV